jgi:hypothetical protein
MSSDLSGRKTKKDVQRLSFARLVRDLLGAHRSGNCAALTAAR